MGLYCAEVPGLIAQSIQLDNDINQGLSSRECIDKGNLAGFRGNVTRALQENLSLCESRRLRLQKRYSSGEPGPCYGSNCESGQYQSAPLVDPAPAQPTPPSLPPTTNDSVRIETPATQSAAANPSDHVPEPVSFHDRIQIDLQCPRTTQQGELQASTKSKNDNSVARLRIVYQDSLAMSVDYSLYDAIGVLKRHVFIDFTVENRKDRVDFGHLIVGYFDAVHTDVCGGSDYIKNKFARELEVNRNLFVQ